MGVIIRGEITNNIIILIIINTNTNIIVYKHDNNNPNNNNNNHTTTTTTAEDERVPPGAQCTRSPLEDSRLFGPSPWKILATTYEQMGS